MCFQFSDKRMHFAHWFQSLRCFGFHFSESWVFAYEKLCPATLTCSTSSSLSLLQRNLSEHVKVTAFLCSRTAFRPYCEGSEQGVQKEKVADHRRNGTQATKAFYTCPELTENLVLHERSGMLPDEANRQCDRDPGVADGGADPDSDRRMSRCRRWGC